MDTRNDHLEMFKNVDAVIHAPENDTISDFEEGKDLWLHVKVEDSMMARYLLRWLYSVKEDGEPYRLCGCRLHQLGWIKPTSHRFMDRLKALIAEEENDSNL